LYGAVHLRLANWNLHHFCIVAESHAGVRSSCFAALPAITNDTIKTHTAPVLLSRGTDITEMLLAGAASSDSLISKRAVQSADDIVHLHAVPAQLPQETWTAVHACWHHWRALYESLSGYMVELLQPTWKTHVPPLVDALRQLQPHSSNLAPTVSLTHRHRRHFMYENLPKAGKRSPNGAVGILRGSPETNWLCVLCEKALRHPNAPAQRFLASCVLAIASEGHKFGDLFPEEWLTTTLAEALFDWTLTGSALEYATAVSLMCQLFLGAIGIVFCNCGSTCSVCSEPVQKW
jgi:hypothetical protein